MPKNTYEVLEVFAEKFKEHLSSKEAIDSSVKERNIVIVAPGKGNKGTLSEIDSQFNADGSKKQDAVFTYSEPDRTAREIAVFTSNSMSDRDKLVFTAALFNAASDTVMSDPMNPKINSQVDQIRSMFANNLKGMPILTSSYGVNPDVVSTVDNFISLSKAHAKDIDSSVEFSEKLKALNPDVTGQRKHLATKDTAKHKSKEELMVDAYVAIDQFQYDNDLEKLQKSVKEIRTKLDDIPKGGIFAKGETRNLVGQLTALISARTAELAQNPPVSRRGSVDMSSIPSGPTSPRR